MTWQPIETAPKERKPIPDRLLLANTHGSMFIGYWQHDLAEWWDTSTHRRTFSKVTHWMPLPEPPEDAA